MEQVGKILPQIFRRHSTDGRLAEVLASLWARVAGPAVAKHSRPLSFAGGTLTLAASCASWAAALGQMAEELRAAINAFLGRRAVRKLRIVVSPQLQMTGPLGFDGRFPDSAMEKAAVVRKSASAAALRRSLKAD